MEYKFKRIKSEKDIEQCNPFQICHYMWRNIMQPETYGWAGYLENKGIYVKMVCKEKNPKITCKKHRESVCKDSAMEVFLAFCEKEEKLSNDVMYINFEANAFGAMYAAYGKGRHGRKFISDHYYKLSQCNTKIGQDKWELELLIPEEFLNEICDFDSFKDGREFYCNFYKISEDPKIEHYGSFSKIENDVPNFHMPVWFARSYIEK